MTLGDFLRHDEITVRKKRHISAGDALFIDYGAEYVLQEMLLFCILIINFETGLNKGIFVSKIVSFFAEAI